MITTVCIFYRLRTTWRRKRMSSPVRLQPSCSRPTVCITLVSMEVTLVYSLPVLEWHLTNRPSVQAYYPPACLGVPSWCSCGGRRCSAWCPLRLCMIIDWMGQCSSHAPVIDSFLFLVFACGVTLKHGSGSLWHSIKYASNMCNSPGDYRLRTVCTFTSVPDMNTGRSALSGVLVACGNRPVPARANPRNVSEVICLLQSDIRSNPFTIDLYHTFRNHALYVSMISY